MTYSPGIIAADYGAILSGLRRLGYDREADALDRAVEREAVDLRDGLIPNPKRITKKAALDMARQFYTDEIGAFVRLDCDREAWRVVASISPLMPRDILSHRRAPVVWAIASILARPALAGPF